MELKGHGQGMDSVENRVGMWEAPALARAPRSRAWAQQGHLGGSVLPWDVVSEFDNLDLCAARARN